MFMVFWGHRIKSAATPGMTPGKAFDSHHQAFDWSMDFQCLDHVGGAGWGVPACAGKKWRYSRLVKFNQSNEYP